MRLAPIPICFHDDILLASESAYLQSLSTHDGEEAAECCKFLSGNYINFKFRPNYWSAQKYKIRKLIRKNRLKRRKLLKLSKIQ